MFGRERFLKEFQEAFLVKFFFLGRGRRLLRTRRRPLDGGLFGGFILLSGTEVVPTLHGVRECKEKVLYGVFPLSSIFTK
jgi:hypothetical protein